MSVNLHGMVPVTVVYDPDEERVQRVIVHDESFEWATTGADHDTLEDLDPQALIPLQNAADRADDWPGWEFGW